MKKHVIALGRQFGSGGREIGRKLSESLGFAYYDRGTAEAGGGAGRGRGGAVRR